MACLYRPFYVQMQVVSGGTAYKLHRNTQQHIVGNSVSVSVYDMIYDMSIYYLECTGHDMLLSLICVEHAGEQCCSEPGQYPTTFDNPKAQVPYHACTAISIFPFF